MKFELDHRTGEMKPVKNNQIYFNRSMSGGLRIDDEINNIKYIIERDGNIKFIFGLKKEVNIYDQRNAHIIADRVKRMFGPDHKYSNYKYFLKGYHMIESYDEYVSKKYSVNEGLWAKGFKRSETGDVRREEGITVKFPLGKVVLGDLNCGVPYQLDPENDNYYFVINPYGEDIYLFGYEDNDTYTYFRYDEDNDNEGEYHLTQVATSDYDMVDDEFILYRAMLTSNYVELDDDLEFKSRNNIFGDYYYCECGKEEYIIFDNYNSAKDTAIDMCLSNIKSSEISQEDIERWSNTFNNDYLESDAFEEMQRESFENYVNDIESESGDLGNRLFDELRENDLIEDTDEYFERIIDEEDEEDEGYLDYESPIFDVDDMKEKYIDILCDREDPIDWYINNFGTDNIENYIDFDKLAELCVEEDGIAYYLTYGGDEEYEFGEDGYTIYIFKRE